MPSAIVVVFHEQLYADVVSVQTSTQSVVPLGAYWNLTLATPRFELAVAVSATVPVSGVFTVPSETATVLKSAAAPIVVGEVDFAVKSAPDDTTPAVAAPNSDEQDEDGAAHAAPSTARRWASAPSWRHRRVRLKPAISSAGRAITNIRTSRRPSEASA